MAELSPPGCDARISLGRNEGEEGDVDGCSVRIEAERGRGGVNSTERKCEPARGSVHVAPGRSAEGGPWLGSALRSYRRELEEIGGCTGLDLPDELDPHDAALAHIFIEHALAETEHRTAITRRPFRKKNDWGADSPPRGREGGIDFGRVYLVKDGREGAGARHECQGRYHDIPGARGLYD